MSNVGRLMHTRGSPSRGFYIAVIPPALLALDMVYENTALSWSNGPQMIGFTLLHTVGIILFPAVLASLIWAASTVVVPVFTKKWSLANIGGALLVAGLLGIASLPYGFWVKAFAARIASGPHAAEFLVYMAGLGELSAVKELLEQGVPVNESNRQGRRAIEAAQSANQTEVRAYLESRGGTDKRF